MSTDEVYSSFLDKANQAPAAPAKTSKSDADILSGQYLSSESDEPWREFTSPRTKRVKDAAAFAKLVGQDGDAHEGSKSEYEGYTEVIAHATAHGAADWQVYEVSKGTRVYVYLVAYDEDKGVYAGAQSVKIES